MTLDEVAAAQLPDLAGVLDSCPVGGFQADFVSWGFYSPIAWRNYWHSHSYYEVCLTYAGAGRFSRSKHDYRVGVGDVFVARPGMVHEIESSQDRPLGIAFWGFTLQPRRGGVDETESGWWSGLLRGKVVSDRLGHLPAILSSLAGEGRRPRAGYPVLVEALGAALVVETARAFATVDERVAKPQRPDRSSQVVTTMHRHLVDNLSRQISVRDVAAAWSTCRSATPNGCSASRRVSP